MPAQAPGVSSDVNAARARRRPDRDRPGRRGPKPSPCEKRSIPGWRAAPCPPAAQPALRAMPISASISRSDAAALPCIGDDDRELRALAGRGSRCSARRRRCARLRTLRVGRERDQRYFAVVVDLGEAREHRGVKLVQPVEEAEVARLFRQAGDERRSSSASSGRIGRIASAVPSAHVHRPRARPGRDGSPCARSRAAACAADRRDARGGDPSPRRSTTLTGSSRGAHPRQRAGERRHLQQQPHERARRVAGEAAARGRAQRSSASRRFSGGSSTRAARRAAPRALAPKVITGPNTASVHADRARARRVRRPRARSPVR